MPIARVSKPISRSQIRDRRSTRDGLRAYTIRRAVPDAVGSTGGTGEIRNGILGLGGDLIGCPAAAVPSLQKAVRCHALLRSLQRCDGGPCVQKQDRDCILIMWINWR